MCAIIGVVNCENASHIARQGLRSMQHRGQESAGIVVSDGQRLRRQAGMGLVDSIFSSETLDQLPGDMAIGHTRYSTAGASTIKEAQPFVVASKYGGTLSICHNGNLPFDAEVRADLTATGSVFQSSSDTETVLHMIARAKSSTFMGGLIEALGQVRGAYAFLFMTEDKLIAIKDPLGIRPLCLGRANGGWVLASESCAYNLIDADFVRELEPGEMLVFENGKSEPTSSFPLQRVFRQSRCVFEKVYLARPDSFVFGESASKAKYKMGRQLALEHPVDADMIVPVPDSGVTAAAGYASVATMSDDPGKNIRLMPGLLRDHYSDRTFIHPRSGERNHRVMQKLSANVDMLRGHRVILIDDSLIRGVTSRAIVKMVRQAGATEIHLRICSPPATNPCYYGMDMATYRELIASRMSKEQIADYVECDSLEYLSLQGMLAACEDPMGKNHCDACFTGVYPLGVIGGLSKHERELYRDIHR